MTDSTHISDASARQSAKTEGRSMYVGKPCAAHPGSMRYVASKSCVECAKAARKAGQVENRARDAARKLAKRTQQKSLICEIIGL